MTAADPGPRVDRGDRRLGELLAAAVRRLRAAGVSSPEHDAAALLAHVTGIPALRLDRHAAVAAGDVTRFAALVTRRTAREPLQHLLGVAPFRFRELAVGPGVFVPRPETELLAGWAVERLADVAGRRPVAVDLGTGSGAIAGALATETSATVVAVEVDPVAAGWAARDLAGTGVRVVLADLAEIGDRLLAELAGTVDVVASNPPYVTESERGRLEPEVRDHDPARALYAAGEGLATIRVVERVAAILLRPGGWCGCEHADDQGEQVRELFTATGHWARVDDRPDLAGRSRFVTAQRR